MANKIRKTLTNNWGFKILAVVFAFLLWLVVYNINDPTKTRTFTTSVTVENAEAITDANKYFEILDGTNSVTFVVTAKRSILDKLEDNDFKATADMSRLVLSEDGKTGTVPINIKCNRDNSSLKYNDSKRLKISLEDMMSKQFVISANVKGSVSDGYALGDVSVSAPTVLKVSGPASIVETVDHVVATIDVEGMSMSLTDNVVPILYNEKGEEIDTTKLKLSNATVTVSAKILSTKEVPLHFSTRGTPAGEHTILSLVSNPEKVRLKGSSAALNEITTIEVPSSVLDVSGMTASLTTSVDITEYLPEGVELVDSSEANVTVTVTIEAYETKNYSLTASNITVIGLEDNYSISYPDGLSVTIGGMASELKDLTASDIKGSIDVGRLSEGTHTISVDLDLDGTKYTPISTQIQVLLTHVSADEDTNDGTNTEGDN